MVLEIGCGRKLPAATCFRPEAEGWHQFAMKAKSFRRPVIRVLRSGRTEIIEFDHVTGTYAERWDIFFRRSRRLGFLRARLIFDFAFYLADKPFVILVLILSNLGRFLGFRLTRKAILVILDNKALVIG